MPRSAMGAMLLFLALLQIAPAALAGLCSMTGPGAVASLPRGWREGISRLHRLSGCGEEPPTPPQRRVTSESFLDGLENPGRYFRADIGKLSDEKLGLVVAPKSDFVEVDRVQQAGAVPRWNGAHAGRAVRPGDLIVAVNGLEGDGAAMAEELRSAGELSLRIFRADDEDRERGEAQRREAKIQRVLRMSGPYGLGDGIPEPSGSKVAVLHAKNVDQFVALQPVVLVMFYASWCGHCRQLAPDYTRAADVLAQMDLPVSARVAKFDDGDGANQYYGAGSPEKFNFTSYPSFVYFDHGKPSAFYGADGAQEIAAQVAARVKGLDVESEVREVVFKMRPMLYRPDVDGDVVLDLEPETFDEVVLRDYPENNRVWIVEFYSDRCPFCKSLKPEIIKASQQLKQDTGPSVKLAGVNSRAFGMLAERFGVTSYPWIIAIYAGRKLDDMAGLGGAESVVNWAKKMRGRSWKKDPVWSETPPAWPRLEEPKGGEERLTDNVTGTWREILGRRTWFFLHTLAAKYPEEPSNADQAAIRHLVAALGQHYPCPICRRHLRAKLLSPELGRPPTNSRQELAKWFCRLHDMVNTDLNKTRFNCNAFELDLKYLKSCGECSARGDSAEDGGAETDRPPHWDYFKYLDTSGSSTSMSSDSPRPGRAVADEL